VPKLRSASRDWHPANAGAQLDAPKNPGNLTSPDPLGGVEAVHRAAVVDKVELAGVVLAER
jgi:hypothetical protein